MDSDKQTKNSNAKLSAVHVLQSFWVRCSVQNNNGVDRFLLDYGYHFLPYIGVISWVIFLFL